MSAQAPAPTEAPRPGAARRVALATLLLLAGVSALGWLAGRPGSRPAAGEGEALARAADAAATALLDNLEETARVAPLRVTRSQGTRVRRVLEQLREARPGADDRLHRLLHVRLLRREAEWDIESREGHRQRGFATLRRALAETRRLLDEDPEDREAAFEHALTAGILAIHRVFLEGDKGAEAFAALADARAAYRALLAAEPRPDWQRAYALFLTHHLVALDALPPEERPRAQHDLLEEARELLERLLAAGAWDPDVARDLAIVHHKLSGLWASWRLEDQAFHHARCNYDLMRRVFESSGRHGYNYCFALEGMGDTFLRAGDHARAREFFEGYLEVARGLVREDPDDLEAWDRRAHAAWRCGEAALRVGDLAAARRSLELADEGFAAIEAHRARQRRPSRLAIARMLLEVRLAGGAAEGLDEPLDALEARCRALLAEWPDHPNLAWELVEIDLLRARVALARGDEAAAAPLLAPYDAAWGAELAPPIRLNRRERLAEVLRSVGRADAAARLEAANAAWLEEATPRFLRDTARQRPGG